MNEKPIERIEALKPLSRDHHHGLLLCWKIREGIKRNVETERLKKYVDWFWRSHLEQHFEIEEKYIFPILGNQNELIKQALAEHRKLKQLFENKVDSSESICLIEQELDKHIRFEERLLFNEIQAIASSEQILQIQLHHADTKFSDNVSDAFWE